MSHVHPVLFRAATKAPSPSNIAFDQTLLGTPVPVAHSTISQKTRQRTYVLGSDDPIHVALPILEHSTDTDHANPKVKESPPVPSSGPSTIDSPSILNIESMQGLSGSVLDQSLQARTRVLSVAKALAAPSEAVTNSLPHRPNSPEVPSPASFEEAEAEAREIQFDEAELKCLEDAFSDLDCVTSEAETTLPTKACATVSFGRHGYDRDKTLSQTDDSATTVSSLHTASGSERTSETQPNVDNTAAVDFPAGPDSKSGCGESEQSSLLEPMCVTGRAEEKPKESAPEESVARTFSTSFTLQSLLTALTAANSITPTNRRRFSHLPCLTGLSSILEAETGLTESLNHRPGSTSDTRASVQPEASVADPGAVELSTERATVPMGSSSQLPASDPHTSLRSIDHLDMQSVEAAPAPPVSAMGDGRVAFVHSVDISKSQVSLERPGSLTAWSSTASKISVASFTSVTQASLSVRDTRPGADTTSPFLSAQRIPPPTPTVPVTVTSSAPKLRVSDRVPPDEKPSHAMPSMCNESPVDMDQSTTLVSCLHMSDVDGLLDIVGAGGEEEGRDTNKPLPSTSAAVRLSAKQQLDKQTVAQLRAMRFTSSNRGPPVRQDGYSEVPNCSPTVHTGPLIAPIISQDENLPPTGPVHPDSSSPSSGAHLFAEPHGVPQLSKQSRRHSVPRPVLHEHQVSMVSTAPSSSALHTSKPELKRSASVSTAPVVSPLLSNTDCLIWCGASCGLIQYQDLLIKHQMERPVTVNFRISPGSDVFKLVNELGYLLSGGQTVQLPPGLEYAVKIAYVARQPLAWDTGQLQLSLDEPERSVWKVRLIGYSNSSQLVCSCCKRLSSEVYWTTAVKVQRPLGVRPSLARRQSPLTRHGGDSRSPAAVSPQSPGDTSITAVVLTNCGARVAWVWACAEPLSTDHEALPGKTGLAPVPIEAPVDAAISIEPSRTVIGPMHSQQITITMRPGLKACRIVFYYGDEVLRHQIRQHFILPVKPQTDELMMSERSDARKTRRQIRIADLMRDFVSDVPFPIAEVPSSLKKPIRPEDWRRALSQQLRLHQHIVLNVYALSPDPTPIEALSEDMGTTVVSRRSDSPTTLASIHVQEDAFRSHSGADEPNESEDLVNRPQLQSESEPQPSRRVPTGRTEPSLPASHIVPVPTTSKRPNPRHAHLTLNPAKVLVFPACSGEERSSANFSLTLDSSTDWPSGYACKIMWSAFPVTDAARRSSVKTGSESQLSNAETVKDAIFEWIDPNGQDRSTPSLQGARTARGFGLLFPAHEANHRPSTAELRIPFAFRPRLSDSASSYRQDWCITVWAQPTNGSVSHQGQPGDTAVDVSDRNTAQFVFPVTLEGQYHARVKQPHRTEVFRSPTDSTGSQGATTHSVSQSSTTRLSSTTVRRPPRLSRSGRVMEVGPLQIAGLPVCFKAVERSSESPGRTHELELMNLKHPGLLFVKLELPRAPFGVERPKETRFRILPNRCVRVLVSYSPTELGTAESVLGVEVLPLPVSETADRSVVGSETVYRAEIPLRGAME